MGILKASLVFFLITSSTFSQSNKELLVGTWTWQSITEKNGIYTKIDCRLEFKKYGLLYITVDGIMRVDDEEVVFKYFDKSKWDVIGDIYTEKTIKVELLEIKGSPELQQIVKDRYLHNESTNKAKIIKIDNNVCIFSFEKEIAKLIRLK